MDYKKELLETIIAQCRGKRNLSSLFVPPQSGGMEINMDYKKKIIEMLEKADHDQLYTIFRFVCSFLGIK